MWISSIIHKSLRNILGEIEKIVLTKIFLSEKKTLSYWVRNPYSGLSFSCLLCIDQQFKESSPTGPMA
jgi:hypothetical protein